MNEKNIVENAINSMKECEFNCMPMPEFRDKYHQFDSDTQKMVSEANCRLEWLNTHKNGCWHVIPN